MVLRHRMLLLTLPVVLLAACKDGNGPDPDPDPIPPEPQGLVESHFDGSNEEWTVVGGAQQAQQGAGIPDHFPDGGYPAGFISATDAADGTDWYWNAPAKFLGNQMPAYGQPLRFDLKQSGTLPEGQPTNDLYLIGGSGTVDTLMYDYPNNPTSDWTSYTVTLQETGGWVRKATGQAPTTAEFQAVLSSVVALQILGEFRPGQDFGGLDNVVLAVQP